jgi:hypothetical protein
MIGRLKDKKIRKSPNLKITKSPNTKSAACGELVEPVEGVESEVRKKYVRSDLFDN